MATVIGYCNCPACGDGHAEVRENVRARAYVSCEECNSQLQTRTKPGDRGIRSQIHTYVESDEHGNEQEHDDAAEPERAGAEPVEESGGEAGSARDDQQPRRRRRAGILRR